METDNKEERQNRIKLLRQQEDQKKRLPYLLSNLSNIAGIQFSESHVLTFQEIDVHQINQNSSDFDFNYLNISFPQTKLSDLVDKLQFFSAELNQTNYLTFHRWAEIAVLKINTSFIINNLERLIELDKDSFYVHDTAYKNGLWVDLYRDYWFMDGAAELRQILELRIFGKHWIKKIATQI